MLAVLLAVVAFGGLDWVAFGLLLQGIKADLHLSDTQLGILTGVAPALVGVVSIIPLARWADRGNRVMIIALTTALCAAAMVFCAAAATFPQLLLIRAGVVAGAAAGIAGISPVVLSLVADYFTREERPRAFALCMLGGPLSALVGYPAAGWLNQFYGWRMTYVLLGLPGLGVAAWARFSLREPRAARPVTGSCFAAESVVAEQRAVSGTAPPSLKQVTQSLLGNATFRHLLICLVVAAFVGNAIWQFQPAFMARSYGMKSGELGTLFAAVGGLSSTAGIYLGGEWASRRAANNERLQLKAGAFAYFVFALLSVPMYLSTNRYLTFALMGMVSLVGGLPYSPLYATIQTLVPPRSRATSIALVNVLVSLIGVGLGPLVTGALSDALRHSLGEESLRYAMLALCPGYVWVGWHLWRASTTVARDLQAANERAEGADSSSRTPGAGGVVVSIV